MTELKTELGRRGLSQTGLKFDLAQRLQAAMDDDEFGVVSSSSPCFSTTSALSTSVTAVKDQADSTSVRGTVSERPLYRWIKSESIPWLVTSGSSTLYQSACRCLSTQTRPGRQQHSQWIQRSIQSFSYRKYRDLSLVLTSRC